MCKEIHDIFKFPFEIQDKIPNLASRYINGFQYSYKKIPKYLLHKMIFSTFIKKIETEQYDYVFLGTKITDIVNSLAPSNVLVLGSIKDILINDIQKKEFQHSSFPINIVDYDIEKIYTYDASLKSKMAKKIVNRMVAFFKKVNPKFFIVFNDSFFIERYLIHCAREAGVKTICIQDGFFQSRSNSYFHGHFADYMYVWSQQQKDVMNKQLLPEKIKILGYPHQVNRANAVLTEYSVLKICILGQPWEKISVEQGEKKKLIFNELTSQLSDLKPTYKPHPAEEDMNFFPNNIQIFNGSLTEAIKEYDYFISFTSTALLEVSLANKIAIQLYDDIFDCDNFEDIGIAYTYHSSNIDTLRSYLEKINKPFSIENDSLFVADDLGQRFKELEKEVLND